MPRKVFTAGEILTAADVNTNLMDQSVMVFDDATARATAIPTPVEGMVTYLKDEEEVTVFDGSAFKAVGPGKILQVVQTVKTNTFSTASTTFTDVTDLSVGITPSSTASKVLVIFSCNLSNSSAADITRINLARDTTDIFVGTGGSSRNSTSVFRGVTAAMDNHSGAFLDSPNTTSAVTYKIRMAVSAGTGFLNRRGDSNFDGVASSITVMEVAG